MVSLPSRVRRRTSAVGGYVKKHLNFFRIHVLFFTFTPLIFSAILYASNGEFPLSYIDALFNSVSAVTVCGLATVDLSGLTPWQQFLLLFQMSIGNPVIVSWVMVYTRRQFFKRKFINIVEAELSHRVAEKLNASVEVRALPWWKRIFYVFSGRSLTQHSDYGERSGSTTPPRVRPDMIRRMDDALKPVNPSGWISEGQSPNPNQPGPDTNRYPSVSRETDSAIEEMERQGPQPLVITNDGSSTSSSHRRTSTTSSERSSRSSNVTTPSPDRLPQRTLTLPRTQTVDFAALPRRRPVSTERGDRLSLIHDVPRVKSMERTPTQMNDRRSMARPTTSIPYTTTSRHAPTIRTKHSGFGGFPMPHEILTAVFRRFFPKLERQLTRTVTIPISHTIASMRDGGSRPEGAKLVSYISFEAGCRSKLQIPKTNTRSVGGAWRCGV
ncbi:hypothetical protein QCA50_005222 [Cerrena zonata]|uniref:Uncharacterized protein n=1 Tax=Cerrena zonata TaxID=2478898 RepID=A0AAW0GL00_9APHY